MSFFTTANFGNWQFWGVYDPPNGLYGDQKVAFDGYNKIIYVADGVRTLDVKADIYSAWKEWVLGNKDGVPAGSAWPIAISAIGGEPLNDTLNVGSTFFLENGWRIQPLASKTPYILTVNGNIYTREAGGNPFLFAEGVSVNLTRSNIVDQVVATSALSSVDLANIATEVWGTSTLSYTAGSNVYGGLVKGIDSDLGVVDTKVDKTLTKGEFLALK
jgi:hypothetical protein